MVAKPDQKTAGAFDTERLDQLFAQHSHDAGMDQQHALFIEPDLAVFAVEADLRQQILLLGKMKIVLYSHCCIYTG